MTNKSQLQKNKGFTLIEVLVAIFILITAVVVPLTIGSKAFAYSNFVRDQSTASYLAQEAIEYIRLQRDNASLNPALGWSAFKFSMSNCMYELDDTDFGGCWFDTQDQTVSINSCDGKCPPLYRQESDGTYKYGDSFVSNKYFRRSVETFVLDENTPLERLQVEVTIIWNTNGINQREFTVTDYLTPWQI